MQGPMLCMQGQGVVNGYAIGRAVVMSAAVLDVPHYRLAQSQLHAECERLRNAVAHTADELQQLAASLPKDAPRELGPLLEVHSLLLADPSLVEQTCQLILEHHYNAQWALMTQGEVLAEQFVHMHDAYLRERSGDVRQVIERVLRVLSGTTPGLLAPTTESDGEQGALIVVARDISPADMLRLRESHFAAFLTDLGGPSSHTAIIARSLNVPAVVGLGDFRMLVRDGDTLIVDGFSGAVLVNPSPMILAQYRQHQQTHQAQRAQLAALRDTPAITKDGIAIELHANIETPDEVDAAVEMGADGIGLFRSEFLFLGRECLPDEQHQYEAYARVVQSMGERPVTIRTLDIGADKVLDTSASVAINPALGLRAVRYCLAHPELFSTQLRALLRASSHGHVRILIPMVTDVEQLHEVRRLLQQAQNYLRHRDPEFVANVSLGAMVETPAMALAIEDFLDELDFVSIGTNDLIQYTLAVDRADPEVADLYNPLHPAVLRLIAHVIRTAVRCGKPVSMCGEMAGNPDLTPLLLRLGLTSFSMPYQNLLDVKKEVLSSDMATLQLNTDLLSLSASCYTGSSF